MRIITIIITVSVSLVAAVFFGNVLSVILPQADEVFDRKPFNCRPCFTFHLAWIPPVYFALVWQSLPLLVCGITAAFILFFIVKYIDNQKIEE